jgi:hypothetical protein
VRSERRQQTDEQMSATEELVAQIWATVLGLEQVRRDESFFELGGHSLLAVKVISRTQSISGRGAAAGSVRSATLAAFAKRITAILQGETSLPASLQAVPRTGQMPLSLAQQRLWMVEQFEPDTAAYNIPTAVRLSGPLDVPALERSFNEIVRRHETLRTRFVSDFGQPVQVILPELSINLAVIDLRELPIAERQATIARLANEEVQSPFDLSQCPLLRATLLRSDEEEHVLLLTMHHIISDGWSIEIFMHEMAALYEAFSTGKPHSLPDLPIQYADFAHWQREWLQAGVLEKQLAYWKQRLGGKLPVLKLPTDRPRPAVPASHGATQSLVLDQSLTESLRSLNRSEGVTMFIMLLAVFKILLYRYARQEDIIVGTNVAGRNWLETEGLIGFFLNQLVLRTDLSGNPGFKELLGRVRASVLGAYAHQDMPFDRLVDALTPEREIGRTPLFQVKVDLQNNPLPDIRLDSLKLDLLDIHHPASHFDLILLLVETNQQLSVTLHYKTDLFDRPTIVRMLENFEKLLRQVVARPEARLNELAGAIVEADVQQRLIKQKEHKQLNREGLKTIKRKSIVNPSNPTD